MSDFLDSDNSLPIFDLEAGSHLLSRLLGPDAQRTLGTRHDPRLDELIRTLPKLTESDLDLDGVCPICLVSFRARLAEEEMALAMDSPAHAPEDLGVTRLENTCRHVFCRKDISTWIRQSRNSCPTCRRPFLDPLPEESVQTDAPVQSLDMRVLESFGFVVDRPNQVVSLRRQGETHQPDDGHFEVPPPPHDAEDHVYPYRSEYGMYS